MSITKNRKYMIMLFCLMMIPMFDIVFDRAKEVAINVTALVFNNADPLRMNLKKPFWNSLPASARYIMFSTDTTRPMAPGASINSGRNQKVNNFNGSG